jgi:hypothetical protein
MTRAVQAWDRFWFAPQPTSTLALFRIAFGLLTLAWTLLLARDLLTFFSRDGIVPHQPEYLIGTPWTWGLLGGAPGAPVVIALFVFLLVGCVCVLLGYRTRLASAVVFVALVSFERRNPFVFNAGDALIRVMALYLALAPTGASLSLDRLRTTRDRFWEFPARAPWALRLVQIQLSVIYISTVWQKLQGETWPKGTAVSYVLRQTDLLRVELPTAITASPAVSAVVTYGTLGIELAVGVLIWSRRARPFVGVPAIALHLLVDATLAAALISAAMLTAFVAFIAPETASRWIDNVRTRGGSRLSSFGTGLRGRSDAART